MPLTWPSRDALHQLECLLARKALLDAQAAGDSQLQATVETAMSSCRNLNPFFDSAPQLSPEDIKSQLRLFPAYLCFILSGGECGDAFDRLITITRSLSHDEKERQSDTKDSKGKPSTQDKKATVDEKSSDSSVVSYVIQLIERVFNHLTQNDKEKAINPITGEADEKSASDDDSDSSDNDLVMHNSSQVFAFLFEYLAHYYSAGIRHSAAKCLGSLSRVYLSPISQLFIEKFQQLKNDDQRREFASFQKAIGFLCFSVRSSILAQITVNYLVELVNQLKKIERGVLRQEICSSLGEVFQRVLNPHDQQRVADMDEFLSSGRNVTEFNDAYSKLFERVAKWSSKSKHSLFSWELLLKMLVLTRDQAFYMNKKRFDVFAAVLGAFKNKEFRPTALVLMRNYLRDLPVQFIQSDVSVFTQQMKSLVSAVLPRGKSVKPTPEETPILTEILVEIGRKHTSFMVQEVLSDVLKPGQKEYFSKQKMIALRALGVIAREKKKEMANFIYNLGPLLDPFLLDSKASDKGEDEEKVLQLLGAALTCFPHIRSPSPEQATKTAAFIATLTLHEQREIASLSVAALQEYILLEPNQNFFFTAQFLLDRLKSLSGLNAIDVLKSCNNLEIVLESFQTLVRDGMDVDFFKFQGFRRSAESVALPHLLHPESFVRLEILRFLLKISAIEQIVAKRTHKEQDPALVLCALDLSEEKSLESVDLNDFPNKPEPFYSPLKQLLLSNYQQFRSLFQQAFIHLAELNSSALKAVLGQAGGPSEDDPNAAPAEVPAELYSDEWFPLFKNRFQYLTLAARAISPTDPNPSSVSDSPAFLNSVTDFFTISTRFLQHLEPSDSKTDALFHSIRQFMCEFFPDLHISAMTEFFKCLRAPLSLVPTPPPAEPSNRRKRDSLSVQVSTQESVDRVKVQSFYYHQYSLDLISRLAVAIDERKFHIFLVSQTNLNPLFHTVRDLVEKWLLDVNNGEFPGHLNSARSPIVRHYISTIIGKFLFLYLNFPSSQVKKADEPVEDGELERRDAQKVKDDMLAKRGQFFNLLQQLDTRTINDSAMLWADSSAQLPAEFDRLTSSILNGVSVLLSLGPVSDAALISAILLWLESKLIQSFLSLGPAKVLSGRYSLPSSIHDGLTLSYQFLFRFNSASQFLSFQQNSLSDFHQANQSFFLESLGWPALGDSIRRQKVCRELSRTLAKYSFQALAQNFINHFVEWVDTKAIEPDTSGDAVKLHPGRLLMLALFHQTNSDPEIRQTALALASEIQTRSCPNTPFSARGSRDGDFASFPLIRPVSNPHALVYLRAAFDQSCQFANFRFTDDEPEMFLSWIEPLLSHGTRLFTAVGSAKKERIAAICLPWIRQFGALLRSMDSASDSALQHSIQAILSHVLSLTRLLLNSSSLFHAMVERLWIELLSEPPFAKRARDEIIRFIAAKYRTALEHETGTTESEPSEAAKPAQDEKDGAANPFGEDEDEEEEKSQSPASVPAPAAPTAPVPLSAAALESLASEKALFKLLFSHISRSCSGIEFVLTLFSLLRSHSLDSAASLPLEPEVYKNYVLTSKAGFHGSAGSERITLLERSLFELIPSAVAQQHWNDADGDRIEEFYPLLMHSALVLFPDTAESREVITHCAFNLGLIDSQASASSLFSSASAPSLPVTDLLFSQLHSVNKRIFNRWSEVSLHWALLSRNRSVSEASWRVYFSLETDRRFFFGPKERNFHYLTLSMYEFAHQRNAAQLAALLRLLTHSTEHNYRALLWKTAVAGIFPLLTSSHRATFTEAAKALLWFLRYSSSSPIEDEETAVSVSDRREWLIELGRFAFTVESAAGHPQNPFFNLASELISPLLKGFSHQSTAPLTSSLLYAFSELYFSADPEESKLPAKHKILQLILINSLTAIVNELNHFERNSAIKNKKSAIKTRYGTDAAVESLCEIIANAVEAALLAFQTSLSGALGAADQKSLLNLALLLKIIVVNFDREFLGSKSPFSGSGSGASAKLRKQNFKRLQMSVNRADGGALAVGPIEGDSIPALIAFTRQFLKDYNAFYTQSANNEPENFTISFLLNQLVFGPAANRYCAMFIAGQFLHILTNRDTRDPSAVLQQQNITLQQYEQLSDQILQSAQSPDSAESALALAVSDIAIDKYNLTKGNAINHNKINTNLFNFAQVKARIKAANSAPANKDYLKCSNNAQLSLELESRDCTSRFEFHVFPLLKSLLAEPRDRTRSEDSKVTPLARPGSLQRSRSVEEKSPAQPAPAPAAHRRDQSNWGIESALKDRLNSAREEPEPAAVVTAIGGPSVAAADAEPESEPLPASPAKASVADDEKNPFASPSIDSPGADHDQSRSNTPSPRAREDSTASQPANPEYNVDSDDDIATDAAKEISQGEIKVDEVEAREGEPAPQSDSENEETAKASEAAPSSEGENGKSTNPFDFD